MTRNKPLPFDQLSTSTKARYILNDRVWRCLACKKKLMTRCKYCNEHGKRDIPREELKGTEGTV